MRIRSSLFVLSLLTIGLLMLSIAPVQGIELRQSPTGTLTGPDQTETAAAVQATANRLFGGEAVTPTPTFTPSATPTATYTATPTSAPERRGLTYYGTLPDFIDQIAWASGDKLLVNSAFDGLAWIDLSSVTARPHGFGLSVDSLSAFAVSPDGAVLAYGIDHVVLADAQTSRVIANLPGGVSYLSDLAFRFDSAVLASAAMSDSIRLWNVATQQEIGSFHSGEGATQGIAYSPDGTLLAAAASFATAITVWNVSDPAAPALAVTLDREDQDFSNGALNVIAFSPDGTLLAVVSRNKILLWDVATWTRIAVLEGHSGEVNTISFSPDGMLLASGSSDYTVRLWDLAARGTVATFTGHTAPVVKVAFSPTEMVLFSVGEYEDIRVWGTVD
ncbi:MAG TPA: hypothetical protein PKD09_09165 [Aggregatilinea sp.]|uniref:WD40 repeat domain-containing protein n=1 Tax=Aggregatilinea sp. TaxID=2806333 RepID=UPI002CBAA4B5|nr:hypothetical protein [Aggregatilinea sp.]HML21805.1 hypothetical protein [Aggregatilinea sp.]